MANTILVCCASSIATSTLVAESLRNILSEKKLTANIIQCSYAEVEEKIISIKPILILSTGKLKVNGDIPVITATSFLSGIGTDQTVKEILKIIDQSH